MKNYGGPCMWHWFSTLKMTPFLGVVKADLFVRSLQSMTAPGLQSVSVFLVRARSFSNFLLGFLFDLFCIFMFVLF